jgi:hypothetical protein
MRYVTKLLWRLKIGGVCNLAVKNIGKTKYYRRKDDSFERVVAYQEYLFAAYIRLHYRLPKDSPKVQEARQLLRERAQRVYGVRLR